MHCIFFTGVVEQRWQQLQWVKGESGLVLAACLWGRDGGCGQGGRRKWLETDGLWQDWNPWLHRGHRKHLKVKRSCVSLGEEHPERKRDSPNRGDITLIRSLNFMHRKRAVTPESWLTPKKTESNPKTSRHPSLSIPTGEGGSQANALSSPE